MTHPQFRPIANKDRLFEVIRRIHFDCYKLCKQSFSRYFPNAGNVGVFCHHDNEYELLTKIQEELTELSDNPNQKYYKLSEPIVIPAKGDVPETVYSYLYIRKPDPTSYGQHSGDIDFYVNVDEYRNLINKTKKELISGARIYEQQGAGEMIELYGSDFDALAYVSTKEITEKVRVKFSNLT